VHHGSRLDYAKFAKYGFLLGIAMLTVGAAGEIVGHAYVGSLPAWEETLFFDLEVLGILVALVSPFLFGIFLPLVE